MRNSDCGFLIIVELRKGSQGSFLFKSEIRNPQSAIDWYRRRDSNPHCLVSKTSASCPLGYAGIRLQIWDFGLRIGGREQMIFALIRILHSAIRNRLVDLARFERATSTFAKSRSISAELQVLRLLIGDCGFRLAEAAGVEPARALRDGLANRCHTVRRRLLTFQIADCRLRNGGLDNNSSQSAF